jgi:Phosphotransferase enzyme family
LTVNAFPADPGLPEFAIACDPRRMAELLRRHLRPRAGARIDGCTLEEFRYRPEKRSVLRYRLALSGAPERRAWVTGALYRAERAPGRARAVAEEMAAAGPGGAGWEGPFDPVAFVPEVGMAVQVYPFDRRLPAVRLLADGPTPELAAMLARAAGVPAAAPRRWTSELVRYRPELCAVFRHTLDAGGERHRFYVKLYPKNGDLGVERRLAPLGGRIGDFAVPHVVAELPKLNVLALSEVAGTPLDRLLVEGNGVVAAARVVGASLAAFNLEATPPERRFTAADERARLERTQRLLRWARPDLAPAIARVVEPAGAALADGPAYATHGDLKLDHVLLDDGRPALVDMDSCTAGDPVLDPATLLARMFVAPFEQPVGRGTARAAMDAFADAYFAAVPAGWRERVGPHYAGALLEVAVSVFRRQVPGWADAVAALVEEAARAVR